jgi:hypothetical protein
MEMRVLRACSLLAVMVVLGGCGGAPRADSKALPQEGENLPPSPAVRFLPLTDGTIWTYDLVDESGARGMIVTRARRVGPARFELRTGPKARLVDFGTDGIVHVGSQAYLLKAPLEVGASWRGEGGTTVHVQATDRAIDVPAGKFVGCLETTEETAASPVGTHPSKKVTTVYCANVGIVLLEAEAWDSGQRVMERATLRSFGAPVDIGAKTR